jgi:hypothetical protein
MDFRFNLFYISVEENVNFILFPENQDFNDISSSEPISVAPYQSTNLDGTDRQPGAKEQEIAKSGSLSSGFTHSERSDSQSITPKPVEKTNSFPSALKEITNQLRVSKPKKSTSI